MFDLCRERLRDTESHGLCPFLPTASDEMVLQEDRYKKMMKESLIIPHMFTDFCKL